MPKETYFNLPKEKQERLLSASKKEFSRVSYEEASINKIIKDAEIPRGSFYMYFESKEDLYFYTLGKEKEELEDFFLKEIKKSKGDLIQTFTSLLTDILNRQEKESDTFLKHAVTNTSFRNLKFLNPRMVDEEILKKIDQEINFELFSNPNLISEIFRILQMETIYSLMLYLKEGYAKEEVLRMHKERMNLLKHGIYKRGDLK